MTRRSLFLVLGIVCIFTAQVHAQNNPDFSGVWILDPSRSDSQEVYGQMRVIKQTPAEIDMTAIHYAGYSDVLNVIPWTFRMNRWGPRRGGERSREPIVQARWDGKKLVAVKSPGQSYSVMWIWALSDAGNEMLVEAINWTYIPTGFAFKESSIPSAYTRRKYVYVKSPPIDSCLDCFFTINEQGVTWTPQPGGQHVAFRLQSNAAELAVTCRAKECSFIDIISGSRSGSRKREAGGVATLSVAAQSVIEVKR
jgi:hypothetical protein